MKARGYRNGSSTVDRGVSVVVVVCGGGGGAGGGGGGGGTGGDRLPWSGGHSLVDYAGVNCTTGIKVSVAGTFCDVRLPRFNLVNVFSNT